jgi:hypothetical protein
MLPRYERFVETVRERTGSALRGVGVYRDDETALLYRRGDLDSGTTSRIHAVLDAATQRDPAADGSAHRASVQLYEEAVVVHLPETDSRGTLLSLDPGVARELGGFIEECVVALRSPEAAVQLRSASADG